VLRHASFPFVEATKRNLASGVHATSNMAPSMSLAEEVYIGFFSFSSSSGVVLGLLQIHTDSFRSKDPTAKKLKAFLPMRMFLGQNRATVVGFLCPLATISRSQLWRLCSRIRTMRRLALPALQQLTTEKCEPSGDQECRR